MKTLILTMVCLSCFLETAVLGHGENSDCSEECESMYCPPNDSKKEKIDS